MKVRTLLTVLLLALLLAAPVAAWTETREYVNYGSQSHYDGTLTFSAGTTSRTTAANYLFVESTSSYPELPIRNLIVASHLPKSKVSNYDTLKTSDWTTVNVFGGTADYEYFKFSSGGTDYLSIRVLDFTGTAITKGKHQITGSTNLNFSFPDITWNTYGGPNTITKDPPTDHIIMIAGEYYYYGTYPTLLPPQTTLIYDDISNVWRGGINVTRNEDQSTQITFVRAFSATQDLPSGPFTSRAYISNLDDSLTLYNATGTANDTYTLYPDYPVSYPIIAKIQDPSGNWHGLYIYNDGIAPYNPNQPPPTQLDGVRLYGDIIDVYTGAPVSGAAVNFTQASIGRSRATSATTSGEYEFNGANGPLPNHPIKIQASAAGYNAAGYEFTATPNYNEWYVPILMVPTSAPDDPIEEGKSLLYGYAVTQGSQQPISGATVALDSYGSTTTTSTGFYSFANVTPGDYSITTTATTHDPLSESVTVAAPSTQHNMALTGQHTLTITAKDADTLANIQNATISLSDGQESTQNPITFTVNYGTYTITTAAPGYYPANQYQYIDALGLTTATVLMTAKPEPIPPPEMPNYPPHNVKFSVLTMLGAPISGVNVTAQGIQQTPSSNILERLLGLNMTATPINSELMNGTTDSNGEINFMMVEAVKYQITLYKPDIVNQTLEIYPKEDTYPIRISTLGGSLLPDAGDPLRSILVNVTTSTDNDVGHIHIDYNDTTHKTTALSIQVTQQNTTNTSAPEDVIASYTVANDANVTHTFDLSDYKGHSYFIRLEAEHPDFTTVHRDYAVAFKGVRVPLGPLPDGLYIYVAGFALMLLGGIFTATSATRGVVVIALAGWLFYGFGWLDDLGLAGPAALGLVTVLAIFGVIVTRYKEEGYQ